ncbi:MAG: radical SAM protein [Oscillospiraceae bacterium]|nr:radical SAM protein [Oscillospiraceae bacterium]
MICNLCPRGCNAARSAGAGDGLCRAGTDPKIARAALHMWEEPCISGENGSGTVFFCGCALRCVYCQNREISVGGVGKTVTPSRLREIYLELIAQGAHNINLVTPTHFAAAIADSLAEPLAAPVVWNSSGYESVGTLKTLEGKVQIYMPDMKYALTEPAARYSAAPDYPDAAKAALREMFRQTGRYVLGGDGLLRRGVLIRHLVLPGELENTFRVIDWVAETFAPGDVLFSLMSQYTPVCAPERPEPNRQLTRAEHDAAVGYLMDSRIEDGFYQDPPGDEQAYIPLWDLTGV